MLAERQIAKMYLPWALLLGVIPLTSLAQQIEPVIYQAGLHQAKWQSSGSEIRCELSHEIPGFGIARFVQQAGEGLAFSIESNQTIPAKRDALLREITPPWSQRKADPLQHELKVLVGTRPVVLQRNEANWLLSSLGKGQIDSFELLDWHDERKKVEIHLSPVNFQRPYAQFHACAQKLLPHSYTELRVTEVNFAFDDHTLDAGSRQQLLNLARYIEADSSIKRVEIGGHGDDRGSHPYNDRLSAERAKSVYDFLATSGVSKKLMTRHAYGRKRLKIDGRSEEARAANRRVEIRLLQ